MNTVEHGYSDILPASTSRWINSVPLYRWTRSPKSGCLSLGCLQMQNEENLNYAEKNNSIRYVVE